MKMLLITKGTGGDLYPFMELGKALKARGHQVTLLTHCYFEDGVRRSGIEFAAFDSPEESEQRVFHNPLVADPKKLLAMTRRDIQANFLRECELVRQECDSEGTVLIAQENSHLVAQTVSEKLRLPFVSFFLSPSSVSNLPFIAESYSLIAEDINRARAEINLAPVNNWEAWICRARLSVGMWPEWFAPYDSQRLQRISAVGFIRNPEIESGEIPSELRQILRGGEAPILVTHGTTIPHTPEFFVASIEASRLLGKRAVLVTPFESQVPARLPDGTKWFKYLPFGSAMPQMEAVIHHGGIGTSAQSLEAGIPQAVLAFGYDRPSNAARLQSMGVATHVPPIRWHAEKIALALDRLLKSPFVRERCRHFSLRFDETNSAVRACQLIEQFLRGRSRLNAASTSSRQEPQRNATEKRAEARGIQELIGKLSPEKRTLLATILKKQTESKTRKQTIPHRKDGGPAPLSFAQQRMWFLDRLTPRNPAYNLPFAARLKGQLSPEALAQSLTEVIRRHEVLRTNFEEIDRQPVQVILTFRPLRVPIVDLRGLPLQEREDQMQRLVRERGHRSFDLAQGPLLGANLIQLSDEEHVLSFAMHHIIGDGLSTDILVREMCALYEAFSSGRPSALSELPIQYADFAIWQREWLNGKTFEAQLSYWKKQLGGALPVLKLSSNKARLATRTPNGAAPWFQITKSLSQELKALSQQLDVTLFMTLLAVFKVMLTIYSGQEDVIVGTPIANRNRKEVEGLIGFFANSLVLRTNLSGDPCFRELLSQVKEVALAAYTHQDLPFEKLVEVLQPERDANQTPLFQVAFTLKSSTDTAPTLSGLQVSPVFSELETASFDLVLFVDDAERGLSGVFNYSTDLFDAATIAGMSRDFEVFLSIIAAEPDIKLSALKESLDEARRRLAVKKGKEFERLSLHKLRKSRRQAVTTSRLDQRTGPCLSGQSRSSRTTATS